MQIWSYGRPDGPYLIFHKDWGGKKETSCLLQPSSSIRLGELIELVELLKWIKPPKKLLKKYGEIVLYNVLMLDESAG
jgi:hypothetical protein